MTLLRLGTRGSQLALAQARLVADRLEAAAPGLAVELVTIATAGDRDQATPLAEGERPGWFTTAIQEALQRGEVDPVGLHDGRVPENLPDEAGQHRARAYFNIRADALGCKAAHDLRPQHGARHLRHERLDRVPGGPLRLRVDVGHHGHAGV
ncbi:MAG: hypothetical protein K6U88_17305, partial [Dehalococcoidia bacterium]|nr:hypothetical protein [Dehalococcoidia bacterium]